MVTACTECGVFNGSIAGDYVYCWACGTRYEAEPLEVSA
jgi:hypothetical protein